MANGWSEDPEGMMQHAKSSPNAPPPTTLTEHVYCGDSIRGRLLPEATTLVNSIVADITKRAKPHISSDDGTGLIVQVCDREQLHAALALPGSPLEQGADASASTELFCDWLVGSALGTPKVDQVTEITMAGWTKQEQVVVGLHYLTLQDANAIVYMQWQKSEWVLAMRASGIRPFALVLCIAASGDRVTLYELVYVFD